MQIDQITLAPEEARKLIEGLLNSFHSCEGDVWKDTVARDIWKGLGAMVGPRLGTTTKIVITAVK